MTQPPTFFPIPRFQASAGALLWDPAGRLLLLHPTYKDGWTLPGGMLELHESPWQGCRREVAEECGISVQTGRLVAVDTRPARPGRATRPALPVRLRTVAAGQPIRLQAAELDAHRFVEPDQALTLLRPAVRRRVASVLQARARGAGCLYLEDGLPVPAVN